MNAGRELDALVAEKVLGFHPYSNDIRCVYHHSSILACAASECGESGYEAAPHYSTDIAAAWTVIDELRKREIRIVIVPDRIGIGWSVTSLLLGSMPKSADTAPLAICLAAMDAVGVDIEEPIPTH